MPRLVSGMKLAASTADPHPPSTSQNVPRNSAPSLRLSMNNPLVPTIQGRTGRVRSAGMMATWLPETADRSTPMEQVFALAPNVYDDFVAMYRGVWQPPSLDPARLELVRLRVAQLL